MRLFPKLEIRPPLHPLSAAPVNKRATRILPKDCIRGAYYRAIDLTLAPLNHHEEKCCHNLQHSTATMLWPETLASHVQRSEGRAVMRRLRDCCEVKGKDRLTRMR